MKKRLIQILGFLISTLGWLFVLCTIAMDYWRIYQIGGQGGSFIIKVAWYWSNLWKDCFTDSTAVTNCRNYPVLWSVAPFIQAVRGLLMCGLAWGSFAAVFCFLRMECTVIGGAKKTKDKLLLTGAACHFAGGISDIAGYCLYINRIAGTSLALTVGPGVLRKVIYAYGTRTYMTARSTGKTLYTGYYRPYGQYGYYIGSGRSSSSRISKLSQTTPEKLSYRDAFV
ncbi:claudin-10 isoform X2 [Thalassophryne amazonica]|uniref:claudin-10 isoform X2 n=1 Tax=Thalassophryne amazonica TaxID=390379 RepID=UPI001470A4A7|nr:claudin-10 isoform X2 [Thalassophryne amazonica]